MQTRRGNNRWLRNKTMTTVQTLSENLHGKGEKIVKDIVAKSGLAVSQWFLMLKGMIQWNELNI